MCLEKNEKINQREHFDVFYRGLLHEHKRELKIRECKNIEEAIRIIDGLTPNIIKQDGNISKVGNNSNTQNNKKFCKLHNWCKHTTEECRNIIQKPSTKKQALLQSKK